MPQDARDVKEVADASARIRNLQNASCGVGRVESADQLAHAGRIDVGKARQIQQKSSLAAADKRFDSAPQHGAHRRSKRPPNVKDRKA